MLTGEPFCDPNIMQRIEYARKRLKPETKIRIFSNGSLLNKHFIDDLAKIGAELSISINGENAERREELMGLFDFEFVERMIDYADEVGILFQTSSVWHPTMEVQHINELKRFPKASAFSMHNFGGLLYPFTRRRKTNCVRVRELLTIRANGDAVLCCFDPTGRVVFGNVANRTLYDLWTSPKHQIYFNRHSVGEGQTLPVCEECTQG